MFMLIFGTVCVRTLVENELVLMSYGFDDRNKHRN